MVRSWHSIKAIGLVMAGCLFACGVMVVGGSLQQADVGTPPTRFNVRLLRGHRTATGVLNPSSARRQSQAVTQNAKPLSTHQSMEDATLHRQQRQRQRQHRRMVLKTIATTLLAQASAVARTDPRQEYLDLTTGLENDMRAFLAADASERRLKAELKKKIKTEGYAWVAKYAKGGAVKGYESAKSFYIGVDALIGFLASDELRTPKKLSKKVLQKLDAARALIDEGK